MADVQYYGFRNYPKKYRNKEFDGRLYVFVHDCKSGDIYELRADNFKQAAEIYLAGPVERVSKSAAQTADCGVSYYPGDEPLYYYRALEEFIDPAVEVQTLSDEDLLEQYVDIRIRGNGIHNISYEDLLDIYYTEILTRMSGSK